MPSVPRFWNTGDTEPSEGYEAQILEFIDMEHTPKNILIRAVRQGKKRDNGLQIRELADFLHVKPTVVELLAPELWESGEKTKDS